MKRPSYESLRKRRFLLENPHAHIEQLLELEGNAPETDDLVRASRILLQNPYAYLDGDGRYSAAKGQHRAEEKKHSFGDIERLASSIHRRLWKGRFDLWLDGVPSSPVEVLDPAKVAELLGFKMIFVDSLGIYIDRQEKISVAGLLDRSVDEIKISREFPNPIQRFTAAHEIGHAVLHPHLPVVHRDRPIDGTRIQRDRVELEADKFAVYFLLPEKLIQSEFSGRFLVRKFELNEDTKFALGAKRSELRDRSRRNLSRVLASAVSFNGRFFYSMADTFDVTVETMAIRLEELDIV